MGKLQDKSRSLNFGRSYPVLHNTHQNAATREARQMRHCSCNSGIWSSAWQCSLLPSPSVPKRRGLLGLGDWNGHVAEVCDGQLVSTSNHELGLLGSGHWRAFFAAKRVYRFLLCSRTFLTVGFREIWLTPEDPLLPASLPKCLPHSRH